MIEVKHLVKQYGDHFAVNDLSFTVEDGHIFGFLGPNGAGKSTTMNMMTGYLAPTSGDIIIEGHSMLTEPEAARKCIGYLPELPPVYPDMTVREYLKFAAELKKIPKAERSEQVSKVMSLTHIEDMEHRLIGNLSKGYRQRVGLAQAILGFPPVLILDEPSVGLDPKQAVEIRELVHQLARNHTVLISSHILSEIRAVCDRVLIIRNGEFVACNTPAYLEATMTSNNELELTAKCTAADAEAVLASVSGVTQTTAEEVEDGTVKLSVLTERDVREAVFFAFADAKIPLLELKLHAASLEDVFLDLTENTAPAADESTDETQETEAAE